jgi:hypothetical protein
MGKNGKLQRKKEKREEFKKTRVTAFMRETPQNTPCFLSWISGATKEKTKIG